MRTAVIVMAATMAMATAAGPATQARTIPVGATLDVLLQTPLNSKTAKVDQRFEGTIVQDFALQGQIVVPSGARVRGFVGSVRPSGKIDHRGQMTLSFDELRIGDHSLRLRASVSAVLDPRGPNTAARTASTPVVGGNTDRGPAPFSGVLVGAAGALLSTSGSDVIVPVGVIVRIRLDRPLEISTPREAPNTRERPKKR